MKGLKLLDLTQAENMSGLTMTNTINNFDKSKSNYISATNKLDNEGNSPMFTHIRSMTIDQSN